MPAGSFQACSRTGSPGQNQVFATSSFGDPYRHRKLHRGAWAQNRPPHHTPPRHRPKIHQPPALARRAARFMNANRMIQQSSLRAPLIRLWL